MNDPRRGISGRMAELEMFCDAVSVVTMRRAGLDPSRLISCFETLLRYTQERFMPGKNDAHYASPGERKKFVQKVMKWAAERDSAAVR